MKILEMSREFTDVEQYLMTLSPAIESLKNVEDGTKICVDGTLLFEDTNNKGETNEIMTIITPDKKAYCCQSSTFKRSLTDIRNIMGDKKFTVIKTSGVTKNGRDFINCILDVESLM